MSNATGTTTMNEERKVKSPYQRYQKREYPYAFKRCSHQRDKWNSEQYAVEVPVVKDDDGNMVKVTRKFRVMCCGVCNIIMDGPFRA